MSVMLYKQPDYASWRQLETGRVMVNADYSGIIRNNAGAVFFTLNSPPKSDEIYFVLFLPQN